MKQNLSRDPKRSGSHSLFILVLAQVATLSVWFSATAVIPALAIEHGLAATSFAKLATATQAGFVIGALAIAFTGLADRTDPRFLFSFCALSAGIANLVLLVVPPQGMLALISRLVVGAMLAGVYPVGLKIALGWTIRRRGFLASLLVGALTLGSALPHLVTLFGEPDWRRVLAVTSMLAFAGAASVLLVNLGPYGGVSGKFSLRALALVIRDRPLKRAYLGYFGHMWELYAFWAWLPAALVASGTMDNTSMAPAQAAAGTAFIAMLLGAIACLPCGVLADRYGKDRVATTLLICSGISALMVALLVQYPGAMLLIAVIVWGIFVIPDSPLFSAMVADAAPAEMAGSLLTLQTALGFALTILSVQLSPVIAQYAGWQWTFVLLATGPAIGVWGLLHYRR